jgi:hypothetical protein
MFELRRFHATFLVLAAVACGETPARRPASEAETGPAPGDDSGQSEPASEELDVDAAEGTEPDAEAAPDAEQLERTLRNGAGDRAVDPLLDDGVLKAARGCRCARTRQRANSTSAGPE